MATIGRPQVWHRSRLVRQLAVAVAAFVLFDIAAVSLARGRSEPPSVSSAEAPNTLGSPGAAAMGAPPAPLEPQPTPMEISIPSIDVSSPLVGLHVVDGVLEAPRDYSKAGWWTEGVVPGQVGPAVVVGHVDSTRGAAVFYEVPTLRPDEVISITRADGSIIDFKVDGVHKYPKTEFPTRQIYGRTAGPTLRLITCGGTFDRATGHYEDNVIVFATLVPPPTPVAPAGEGAT